MTPELYAMMQEWLENGDDLQRRHAAHRLTLPDAVDYQPPEPDPPKLEYPSLFDQAMNLARAAGGVVSAVVHGEPIGVSQEEQHRRLAICHECEFWDPNQGRCSKCGCFGTWATWVESHHCPLDPPKW